MNSVVDEKVFQVHLKPFLKVMPAEKEKPGKRGCYRAQYQGKILCIFQAWWNIWGQFFDDFFDDFFWRYFGDFFWFDWFFDDFFDWFFDEILTNFDFLEDFFLTYNLLNIASFRIGVPSILFFSNLSLSKSQTTLKLFFQACI